MIANTGTMATSVSEVEDTRTSDSSFWVIANTGTMASSVSEVGNGVIDVGTACKTVPSSAPYVPGSVDTHFGEKATATVGENPTKARSRMDFTELPLPDRPIIGDDRYTPRPYQYALRKYQSFSEESDASSDDEKTYSSSDDFPYQNNEEPYTPQCHERKKQLKQLAFKELTEEQPTLREEWMLSLDGLRPALEMYTKRKISEATLTHNNNLSQARRLRKKAEEDIGDCLNEAARAFATKKKYKYALEQLKITGKKWSKPDESHQDIGDDVRLGYGTYPIRIPVIDEVSVNEYSSSDDLLDDTTVRKGAKDLREKLKYAMARQEKKEMAMTAELGVAKLTQRQKNRIAAGGLRYALDHHQNHSKLKRERAYIRAARRARKPITEEKTLERETRRKSIIIHNTANAKELPTDRFIRDDMDCEGLYE